MKDVLAPAGTLVSIFAHGLYLKYSSIPASILSPPSSSFVLIEHQVLLEGELHSTANNFT